MQQHAVERDRIGDRLDDLYENRKPPQKLGHLSDDRWVDAIGQRCTKLRDVASASGTPNILPSSPGTMPAMITVRRSRLAARFLPLPPIKTANALPPLKET